jgi:hypothetical protein
MGHTLTKELEQELSQTPNLTMTVKPTGTHTHDFVCGGNTMRGFKVIIYNNAQYATFDYSMGMAHTKGPELADVVNCLISDAQCGEMSFEDFCGEFGLSNDSIKALKTHRACRPQALEIVGPRIVGDPFDPGTLTPLDSRKPFVR